MANVTLTRNLGHDEARSLDLDPSQAHEGKEVEVFDDVRDELILQGLAHEAGESESGLDLTDPEIRKKLREKEIELNLGGALLISQQDRQREETARMEEAERDLAPERDRLRREREGEGVKRMEELRNQPPKGPEDQPREAFAHGFRSESAAKEREGVDVEEEEETRRKEQERRRRESQPQPQPGRPQPGQPQPRPIPAGTPGAPGTPRQGPGSGPGPAKK